jgi:hypothetical protein
MNSLRPMPAWPKWTCCSFSDYANRKMPINELMMLSNSLRQLLCSLPRALIRILYLSSAKVTSTVEVRIWYRENYQIILTCEKPFRVMLIDNSNITKSNISDLDPKQIFFHFPFSRQIVLSLGLLTHVLPLC